MNQEVGLKIFALMTIPCLVVAMIMPFIKALATHVGALDIPNARKVHSVPIPRLGGLAIYLGFLLGYMLFGESTPIMNSILIGSFVIVLTGVVDDIKPLKASHKFLGQLFSTLVVVFYGGILLKELSAFGLYIDFGIFAYPVTIFFILGCINCINLIDGLDGLAGGISAIFFLTIGIIATCKGQFGLAFILSFIMFGSCLGFLFYNFNPASIFMGDSGSMFLGFIMSVITLLKYKNVMMTSIIVPLLILTIPISDTLFAIIRRKLRGESISKPDKMHIHHQLLKRNLGQKATVTIIYIATSLFSAASIVYVLVDANLGYILYGVLLFCVLVFALKTDVIFSHHTEEEQKQDSVKTSSEKKPKGKKKNTTKRKVVKE